MGKILPESLEREIAALTTDEKRELATMLRRMVADETSPRGTPGECPLCHHAHVVEEGAREEQDPKVVFEHGWVSDLSTRLFRV